MDAADMLARAALARGDLITAYDLTVSAIAGGDQSSAIRHLQVLALARMGDTERAMGLFSSLGLNLSPAAHERALGARLLKDRALALPAGTARRAGLRLAFDAYLEIYREGGDTFPGINAATLAMLCGDRDDSARIARLLLDDEKMAAAGDYFAAATAAEALLLLGRHDELDHVLAAPAIRDCRDFGARSTTLRQMNLICDHLGIDDEVRERLSARIAPLRVASYCGHMFMADAAAESRLASDVDRHFEREGIGFAYGALACGADLLIAEAALAHGAELHVVLPFDEADFLDQSVRPGGDTWERRFRACMEAASSVVLASDVRYFGDASQFAYGSRMAMGLARLRARHLGVKPVQIAIWDGAASIGPAGTGADVAAWSDRGGRTLVVDPGAVDRRLTRPEPGMTNVIERTLAAILFTDFVGFSTISETALPEFWGGVMRNVAEILDSHEDEVRCRNSWGDALYAVTVSAPAAARIALELQDTLSTYDYASLGLAGTGGMRIAGHYGPAYRTTDPITRRTTFYGTEVSRAARIEPVTPPNAVFVTEPFAAMVELDAGDEFACRYVGRIPLAKNYGEHRMYRLTRAV